MIVETVFAFVTDIATRLGGKLMWILRDQSAAASLIGASVTGASLLFTAYQLYASRMQHESERQWKRSDFVRSLLSEMVENPNIAIVSRILDWREGPAEIPAAFRSLFDHARKTRGPLPWDTPYTADDYFEINWDRFVKALRWDRDPEWREPDMYMYRTCFDSFCTFIQGVAEDVRTIGVAASEYADLSFYCHRIVFPLNAARDRDYEADMQLQTYIEYYYNDKTYNVILEQAQVYARSHPDVARPSDKFPDRIVGHPTAERRKWTAYRLSRAKLRLGLRNRRTSKAA